MNFAGMGRFEARSAERQSRAPIVFGSGCPAQGCTERSVRQLPSPGRLAFFILGVFLIASRPSQADELTPWYGGKDEPQPLYLLSPESLPAGLKACPELSRNPHSLCVLKPAALEALQKELLARYSLPGIVSPPADPEKPEGWIDPWSDPDRALQVGIPVRFKRREPMLVPAVLTLPEISSFRGETLLISQLNTAIDYWVYGRHAEARALLGDLQGTVKARPAGDPERMLVNLVSGFYWLEAFAKLSLEEEPDASGEGRSFRNLARQGFLEGVGKVNPKAYADRKEARLDKELFKELLSSALFLDQEAPKPLKRRAMTRKREAFEALSFIRTVAPVALYNLVSLSRIRGLFGQAFDAAEVLETVASLLAPELGDVVLEDKSVVTHDAKPLVAKPLLIRPLGLADLEAITFLVRGLALRKEEAESLMLLDKAVRKSRSREIPAVAFVLMGSVFYDRGNDFWARRLYTWSEAMAPTLLERFPDALLWGSESTFWRGDYARAGRAFEQLRLHLSDPEYGPSLNLRRLELELFLGESAAAAASLARLQTHYGATHIGPDLVVLDFCQTVESLSPKLRSVVYEQVKLQTKDARYELRERAAACLLKASLLDQEDHNRKRETRDGKTVYADAEAQLQLLKTYDEEFPESPYRSLFEEREKRLGLAPVFASLASNACEDVLSFYLKNEKDLLASMSSQASTPVQGLAWSQADSAKTIRCAAFLRKSDTWKTLGKPDTDRKSNPLASLVYDWREMPTDAALLALRGSLVEKEGWPIFDAKLGELEASNVALLDDARFWNSLAQAEVLAAEPPEPGHVFFEEPLSRVLESGQQGEQPVSLSSHLCLWAGRSLRAEGQVLRRRLARFAATDWTAGLQTKGGLGMGAPEACYTRIKSLAIAASVREPHPDTDESILWPFVEHVGPLLQSEMAFDLAKRSFERSGKISERVLGVMETLALESPDDALGRAAKQWIRKHHTQIRPSVW